MEAGFQPQEIYDQLCKQHVDLVLTAHPTQSARRTVLAQLADIAETLGLSFRFFILISISSLHYLGEHDRHRELTPEENELVHEKLVRSVSAQWRSDQIRRKAPTPEDEARGGLAVVESTIYIHLHF